MSIHEFKFWYIVAILTKVGYATGRMGRAGPGRLSDGPGRAEPSRRWAGPDRADEATGRARAEN